MSGPRSEQSGLFRIGLLLIYLGAATSPWNALGARGLRLSDFLLGGAFLVLLFARSLDVGVPAWVWWGAGSVVAVTAGQQLLDGGSGAAAQVGAYSDLLVASEWVAALLGLPVLVLSAGARSRAAIRRTAWWWAVGCAGSALIAFTDRLGLTAVAARLGTEAVGDRLPGLAAHPNAMGGAAVLALPVLVHAARTRIGPRPVTVGAAVACLLGVYSSGSRGAAGTLLVLLGTAALTDPRLHRNVHLLVPVALLTAAATLWAAATGAATTLLRTFRLAGDERVSGIESNLGRERLADQALAHFAEHPVIGSGIGAITRAHSVPLQLLESGGLVLFCGFTLYALGAARVAWRHRRRGPFEFALGLSIFGWIVLGLVQNLITDRYLYVSIACLAALSTLERRAEATPRPRPVSPDGASAAAAPAQA